jgi:hypothetical protein
VPNDWLKAVVSEHGPKDERDRHVCHVLAHHMRGDGLAGCFPGQRHIAAMIPVDKNTVALSLKRLASAGWVEREPMPRQFGKTGFKFFPAVPDTVLRLIGEPKQSPIRRRNGEPKTPQCSVNGESAHINGEFRTKIGEFGSGIGESRTHQKSLTEISTEGAASPSPATAASTAPTRDAYTEGRWDEREDHAEW